MERENKHRQFVWLCLTIFALSLGGCGGQLYRVAAPPKVAAPVLPEGTEALAVAARMLTGDELLAQFEANLLLAGVVVVDARAANRGNASHTLVLALRDEAGTVFKPLLPKQALQRVMKFYGNRLYAKAAYQNTLAQYEALAWPLTLNLEPQAERRGFLFFATTTDATTLRGLRLTAEGAMPALVINLN